MANENFVQTLKRLSFLLELEAENPFKIKALENAARILEDQVPIEELVASGQFTKIPGVGKGTQNLMQEYIANGTVAELEGLLKKYPASIFEILTIRGLGPKKAKSLYEQLHITSLAELEYACLENRLLDLKGFGAKTQSNILSGIAEIKSNAGKVILPMALQEAQLCESQLSAFEEIEALHQVGNLRRKMETIEKIQFLAVGKPSAIKNALKNSYKETAGIFSGVTPNGMALEIHVCSPGQAGSELFHLTGPSQFTQKFKNIAPAASEETVFAALNTRFLPPEQRDISLQQPSTLEENQIKGVFHFHTKYSDGANTLEEMVSAAVDQGWQYIGVSEHSQSAFYANGLNEKRILEQKQEIEKLQKKYKIRIFQGIESDILSDGSLDYPEYILKQFDFVIASVHGQMKMDPETMTDRIVKAVQNKYTTWLGHWTGRILLGRSEYQFNKEKVIDALAKCGTSIELNSNPYRLDVDWRILPELKKRNIKIGIFPDAHSTRGFDDVKYGVWMARKAGIVTADVVNTLNLEDMEKWLVKQRNR